MNKASPFADQVTSNAFMCLKCEKINRVIQRYQRLASHFTDELLLKGLQQLIDKLEAEKQALHPDEQKQGLQTGKPRANFIAGTPPAAGYRDGPADVGAAATARLAGHLSPDVR